MAVRVVAAVVAVLAVAMVSTTPASAQQSTCTPVIVSLAPCLSYITGNSSAPTSQCCSQLGSVVQFQARCLCTVLNGAAPLPVGMPTINQTQALTLPGACKIQTPPLSQCNAVAGTPATSPVTSPTAAPEPTSPSSTTPAAAAAPTGSTPAAAAAPTTSTPSVPSIPAGNGSKTTPTNGQSSDASSTRFTTLSLFLFLFMSSFASTLVSF